MGSLAHLEAYQRWLDKGVHRLASLGVCLVDSSEGEVIVQNRAESSILLEAKEKQYNAPLMVKLNEGIHKHKTTAFSLGMDDVTLRYQGRVCSPNVDGLRERIMTEAHTSRYSVHPGSSKIYHDLKEDYWWNSMKRNVVDFVSRCPNCQKMKDEDQQPGGLAQSMEILMWKWEMMNREFVVGLPHTPHKFDSIWEIARLHGTPVSIISDREVKFMANFWKKFQQGLGTQMELFEALYGRRCRSPIRWFEIGVAELIGPDLVHQAMEKVSPMKGIMRFGKKEKLSSRYVGPYKIFQRIGQVAYKLELPPEMSLVHAVFHVSMLKKVVGDLSLIVPVETIE
uniref:Uncharacterized protein LOC104249407 n=1 Tax=Nicotiana sylvestris TaxID=4096 RepID=A0A1U7YQ86_NICSY